MRSVSLLLPKAYVDDYITMSPEDLDLQGVFKTFLFGSIHVLMFQP